SRPPPRFSLFPYTTLFRSGGFSKPPAPPIQPALPPAFPSRQNRLPSAGFGPRPCSLQCPATPPQLFEFPRGAGSRSERASSHPRSEEHTSELQSLAYLVCR